MFILSQASDYIAECALLEVSRIQRETMEIKMARSRDTEITFMDGATYRVGDRVQFYIHDWINGTVTGFSTTGRVFITPDNVEDFPKNSTYYYKLNPEAARNSGRTHYCYPRDTGMGGGNVRHLQSTTA